MVSARSGVLLVACTLAACVAREPAHGGTAVEPTLASTPAGPPWIAWREGDEVVVMPLGAIDAAPVIEDATGRRPMSARGGRVAVHGERAVVSWTAASGAVGARAVLERGGAAVTAPEWVPIVPYRPGAPGAPTTDEAVRIR